MTTLEWTEIDGTYVSDGYSIEQRVAHQWLLSLDASRTPSLAPRRFGRQHTYGSLPVARAAALHLEVVRVRRVKLIRHVTTAAVMFALAVSFYVVMVSGTPTRRLEWFILSGAALVIALSESLDAFVLVVADGWDHRYEVPRVSRMDTIVSGLVISMLLPRATSAPSSDRIESVRTLT